MDMSVDESMTNSCHKETPVRVKENRKTLLYAAQKGMFERRQKSPKRGFSVLPTYTPATPGRKVYNPFKTDVDTLGNYTCSPTIFTNTASPEAGFSWSIDDISRINPAPIDSPIDLPEEKLDRDMEEKAQEAIQRYFTYRHDIVSPINRSGQWVSPATAMSITPSSSTPCNGRSQMPKDTAIQTVLSLPPVLPPELEELLKKYNLKNEESEGNEDCSLNISNNSSNSSLRRKLFFEKEDCLSPVKRVCLDGSLTNTSVMRSRIDWTLQQKSASLSSPEISPIKSHEKEGIFTSTIISGSMDTGYSTFEQFRSNSTNDNNI